MSVPPEITYLDLSLSCSFFVYVHKMLNLESLSSSSIAFLQVMSFTSLLLFKYGCGVCVCKKNCKYRKTECYKSLKENITLKYQHFHYT